LPERASTMEGEAGCRVSTTRQIMPLYRSVDNRAEGGWDRLGRSAGGGAGAKRRPRRAKAYFSLKFAVIVDPSSVVIVTA
jgi:hypothetical protein